MGFSRQEYRSGLLFLSPGDLPDGGIEPRSPALQAEALSSEPPGIDRCIYTYADSHCYTLETNTALKSNHIPMKLLEKSQKKKARIKIFIN